MRIPVVVALKLYYTMDFRSLLWTLVFLFRKPSVCLPSWRLNQCEVQERLSKIVIPKYLAEGTDFRKAP